MKVILCLFFGLIAGTLGVYGQLRLDTLPSPNPPVRIMQPDHMSCVVSNLALLQRMPVRRMKSTDPMPNGVEVTGDEQSPFVEQMLRREGP